MRNMTSVFHGLTPVPPVVPADLIELYVNDNDPNKISLIVGAYRTDENKPWVLPVVKEAINRLLLADDTSHQSSNNHQIDCQNLSMEFAKVAKITLLGEECQALKENRVLSVPCVAGTGSIRMAGEVLKQVASFDSVLISDPSWVNHEMIFENLAYKSVESYRYWNSSTKALDIDGMLYDLKNAPNKSVIVLHGCAHNPTGVDPTKSQWAKIAQVIKEKGHFPLFDMAYQGFASGDLTADAWPVRFFASERIEMAVGQSFSKNFGLYSERVGNLCMVLNKADGIADLKAKLEQIISVTWKFTPQYGNRIVTLVLNDPKLTHEWKDCLIVMSNRLKQMRKLLRANLEQLGAPGNWDHITNQIGMFAFTGLNKNSVDRLRTEHHIYMMTTGRISLCGLTTSNVAHVARCIHHILSTTA